MNQKIPGLNGRRILLVNTGSIRKRFILKRLKQLGITIIALHEEINWAKPYVDHWILSGKNNGHSPLEQVLEFCAARPELRPEGVVTFWEDDVLLTAKICEALNLPGIPYQTALKVRNKFRFRDFCKKNGLPTPRHSLLKSEQDLATVKESLTFPLVAKPVFGASSAFVVKVDTPEDLDRIYTYLKSSVSRDVESALSDGMQIMVEEYIHGDEVDIDILLQNGKLKFWSISDNDKTNEPFFVETGQSIPSKLPPKMQTALVDMAEETLEMLGIQNGCIHFEAKATPHGPVPIEVNIRMGGDEVYSFVKGAWGVDLIQHAVQIALGERIKRIDKPELPLKVLRGKYFLPELSGALTNVLIPEDIKKLPGVEEIHFSKRVGDPVLVPPEGYDYLGWVTVSGPNFPKAESNLERVLEAVHFDVAPFRSGSTIGKTQRRSQFTNARLRQQAILRSAKIEHIRRIPLAEQRSLHIGILSNEFTDSNNPIEAELTSDARHIAETLEARGYKVSFFDFNDVPTAIQKIKQNSPDLIFNVCERINSSSLLEPHAAAILDILQIPYTGSNPFTLALCLDKIRVKKLLTYHQIPTPRWDYAHTMDDDIRPDLRFPLIVKPANSDSSIGISNNSVVTNAEELNRQMELIISELKRPALVEEFIEGDEYDVSIMGSDEQDLRVLPLSRSVFTNLPAGYWHIYPYEAKFSGDTTYRESIVVQRPPKNIKQTLTALISEIALDTYLILGCHDYGRVEVRVDKNHNPYVLELNPNPSIGEKDCVPSVAKLAGMSYIDFLEEIISMTIKRYRERPPYYHLQSGFL